jgi:hypothetical protein
MRLLPIQAITLITCTTYYYDFAFLGPVYPSILSVRLFEIPPSPSSSLASITTAAEDSESVFLDNVSAIT